MVRHFVIRVTSGAGRSDHPMNAWKPAAMFDETAKAVQSLRVSDQMELRKDVQRYGVMPSALGEEWLRFGSHLTSYKGSKERRAA